MQSYAREGELGMTPSRWQKIQQVLAARQPDLTVLADGLHKSQNISALLRTCDAVGIGTVHWYAPAQTRRRIWPHSSGGSARWVELIHHEHPEAAIHTLKQQGLTLIGAHADATAQNYLEVDYTQPCVIVMGAEKEGLSDTMKAACDTLVQIPMQGMVASYNVSVAAALILEQARQQRWTAGFYQGPSRLPEPTYQRLVFQWAHPQIARFCDARNLPYPPLDASGELTEHPQAASVIASAGFDHVHNR
jgi:tRNA (guanosine-2'-O-)-methyltransferase